MLGAILGSMRSSRSSSSSSSSSLSGNWRSEGKEGETKRLLFVNSIGEYRRAQKAMTKAHKSQMRWFRWGWIVVGRYMVVNDLRRERVV